MFLNEMTILAHLDHPNIVRSLACTEVDGELVMALEFLEGADPAPAARRARPAALARGGRDRRAGRGRARARPTARSRRSSTATSSPRT